MLIQDPAPRPPWRLMTRSGEAAAGPLGSEKPGTAATIKRVAIVEDEIMVAWSIETMLEDGGYDVVGVYSTGEQALAGLAGRTVDLLCMDINLGPGIDGIETAGRIRSAQPAAVIFISAYSDAATKTRIEETVPQAVLLTKPVTFGSLREAIRGLIETEH